MRERALGRCVADVVACPAGLDRLPIDGDPCLDRAAIRCQGWLAAVERFRSKASRTAEACAVAVGPDAFLDDDGLGYDQLAVFCPRLDVEEGVPVDALACQSAAIDCAADTMLGTLAPRAAELLARIGVSIDGAGCLAPHQCGDGEIDDDEECDDGIANSDTTPDACRTTCVDAFCGDGTIDDGEECDDGNQRDGDGCDADCAVEAGVCGNGTIDDGEECDDGNHVDGDGCGGDCTIEAGTCGNGIVEDDEECDDGNHRDGDGCSAQCTVVEGACGNGVVEGDEECDAGASNSDVLPDRCRTDCRSAFCGDGVVDPLAGEACEPPDTLVCDTDCAPRLPLASTRSAETGGGLPTCERALLRRGLGVAERTHRLVADCIRAAGACVLGVDDASPAYDRCVARASRRCALVADARDRALRRAIGAVTERCGRASSVATLLRSDGLGFETIAANCPFAGSGTPTAADLVACVLDRARCLGERLVAYAIPRAYELLSQVEDDPEARFACVVDPDDYGDDDVGSPAPAFIDVR